MNQLLYKLAELARQRLKGIIELKFPARKVQDGILVVSMENDAILILTSDGHNLLLSRKATRALGQQIPEILKQENAKLN